MYTVLVTQDDTDIATLQLCEVCDTCRRFRKVPNTNPVERVNSPRYPEEWGTHAMFAMFEKSPPSLCSECSPKGFKATDQVNDVVTYFEVGF